MRDMFVWRKSVYDNNFKCNQCGTKLFNPKTGKPTDNLAISADDDVENPTEPIYCYCGNCKNPVATWQPVENDEVSDNILQGSYSEWIEKKALDLRGEMQLEIEEKIVKRYDQKIKLLKDEIASKDALINRLKEEHRLKLLEKDREIQKLSKEVYHNEMWLHKMMNMLEDMNADAEGKVQEFQSALNEELGILGN